MKERSIIFSTEMVRAILDGRTATGVFIPTEKIPEQDPICNKWVMRVAPSGTEGGFITAHGLADKALGKFPFGQDGDRLWVKETFFAESDEYDCCGSGLHYRADADHDFKWERASSMPREFSRITLEIIDIRAEERTDKWFWVRKFKNIG